MGSSSVTRASKFDAAIKITLIYVAIAVLWVLLSDRILAGLISDPDTISRLRTPQGWAFVFVSAAVLYFLIRRNVKTVKASESALRRSEDKQQTILENAAEGVVILNGEGIMEYVNARTEKMFGFSREELIGKDVELLLPDSLREFHTKLRASYIEEPRSRPMGQGMDLLARRKDGTEFPVEIGLSFDKSEQGSVVVAFITDITTRKRAEELLRSERDKTQRYLDVAGAVFLIIGADRKVELINRKGCEILGYDEEEIVGKDWFENFLPERNRENVRAVFEKLMDGEIEPVEYFENYVRVKDGGERIIAWHNTVLRDADGRIRGTLSSGEDITERKRAEEEAKLSLQKLQQADKMATLGILVSGIAHEINNPNNFILLNGNILSKVWLDLTPILQNHYDRHDDFALAGMPYTKARDKLGNLIDGISEGARRIQKIVQNLKDFARQDSGDLDQDVSIHSVVESAIVIVDNLVKKSTDRFFVEHGNNLPMVKGNFQNLEQVVINLLTNACQALPDKEKGLFVSTRYDEKEEKIIVEVRDEGIGISPNSLERIMDPFFTTKRESGGTGLGLSISYNIIKDHGGDLKITSESEKGTRAIITLPVQKEQPSGD